MSKGKDTNFQMLHLYVDRSHFDKDRYTGTVSFSYFCNYAGMDYLTDKDVDLPIKGLFQRLYIYRHRD